MTRRTTSPATPSFHRHPLAAAIAACLRQPGRQLATAAGLSLALGCPSAALAATYVVTNTDDAGPGSLRQAVLDANANPGADEILFDSTVRGSISLVSGTLEIADALTVTGPGASALTLGGAGASAIFAPHGSLYLSDTKNLQLTVSGLTLTNAGTAVSAFEIYGSPVVLVSDSVITGNSGSGIYSYTYFGPGAAIEVGNSVVSGNSGRGVSVSSGRYSSRSSLRVEGATVSGNGSAGIRSFGANIYIRKSTVSSNVNGVEGDGFWDYVTSGLTIVDSTISGNSGQGIELYSSQVDVERCAIASNLGAGISIVGGLNTGARIESSAISSNGNGGVRANGYDTDIDVSNSTISGNQNAPAVSVAYRYARGAFKLTTIVDNPWGGVFANDVSEIDLSGSIVARNGLISGADLSGSASFQVNYSLIQDPGASTLVEGVAGSNLIGQDPLLGPLQDNGGPTLTHSLLPTSPALDAGNPDFIPPPAFDQRGEGFDRVVGGRIDMGALESQATGGWLRAVGDINRDGTPEIAVLQRDDWPRNLAAVKDVTDGSLISQFEFDATLRPVDVEAMSGFASGYAVAPNLATLGSTPIRSETRDVLTGSLVGSVAFNTLFAPVDLTVLPDQNGNGVSELAALETAATKLKVPDGLTERVSVDSQGDQSNDLYGSHGSAISADGRFVAFYSLHEDLVPDDTNNAHDVFVHDRATGETERVSVDSDGVQGNASSLYPAISADGRFVSFASIANNLVPGDTNSFTEVFVHDRTLGRTERVAVSSAGVQGNGYSFDSALSADGRFVAFSSLANNLVPGDTNGFYDIFVRDRATGTTERVSVDSNGGEANGYSYTPTISADGRFVAFYSLADTLVSGDTNDVSDVFVHDRATGATERVSVNTDGSETFGLYGSRYADISADGRFVVFASDATDLIADDTDDVEDIFVHDLVTGTTDRVSVDASNPVISGDGRYVAFESFSDNLVPGGNNYELDVFVHDREAGTTEQVSVDTCGIQGDDRSDQPAISADGLVVAFTSEATNLVADDTNGVSDVFVRTRDVTASPPPGDTSEPARCIVDADSTKVEVRDAVTGDLINNLWFAPSFDPRQVVTLPDLNGNGSAEVGVVLSKADETDRVAIKDTRTGERVGTLMAWQPQQGFELLQALPVPDADGNPTGKVALLLHEPATGKTLVRVTDAATNAQLAMVRGFNPGFDPVKLVAVSDLNGNGAEEYALLARDPDTGQVHAKVLDGASSELISTLWFSKDCVPLDMVSVADINANGAEELVMLGRCGAEAQLKAVVKDARTAEALNRIAF